MSNDYAPTGDFKAQLERVGFVCEATHTESFYIWKIYVNSEKMIKTWQQHGGYLQEIGRINDRPICISVDFVTIDGLYTAFVEMTSQLCDYVMMEEWLEKYCPIYTDRRNRTSDAMNFGHIFRVIEDQHKG